MTSVMISRSPGSAAGRASAISSKSAPAAAAVAVSGGCHRQRARSGLSAPRASGAAQSAGFGAPQQQQPQQQQRHVAWRPRNASHRSRGGPVRFREDEKQTEAATRAGAKKRSVVPVILKYGKRCNFGEAFAVVGSVPELGSWDPTRAVKMTWTAGDVWLAHVQLPVDTEVQYKYVRINKDGAVVAWEGVDAANGGAGGPMGNINLHVRPGHRVIWGHGVEVYADLPPEYADFARAPLPSGTSAVVPSTIGGGPAGEAGGGVGVGVGGGSGVLSSVKETARGALAALESALTGGGHTTETTTGTAHGTTTAAHTGGHTVGSSATTTTTTTTSPTASGHGSETSAAAFGASGVNDYPSFTPAPGISGTTIGDVAAAANAPATTHERHVAPAANDYTLSDTSAGGGGAASAVQHITSTDLAASLIAAGPAAGAVSAATLGLPADEAGNIPVVTPVAPPAAAAATEYGGSEVGATTASGAPAAPPTVTMSGAPADQYTASTSEGSPGYYAPAAADQAATTGPPPPGESGPGNNGTGESGTSGTSRRRGFFRK